MSSSRRLLSALVLVLVALLSYSVVEVVIGHGPGAPDKTRAAQPRPQAGLTTPFTPAASAREPDDSPQAAVAVAARYLEVLDEASRSRATSSQLRALTLPPLTQQALRVEAVSAALKQRLSDPGAAFVRGWRLGWRVISFTPRHARIGLWAMGTVQSSQEVLPPNYSTTLCALRLTGGGWRVFAAATKPGPTPPADGSDHRAVISFVRQANRFQPFSDAP
jgi:hypothetical protein